MTKKDQKIKLRAIARSLERKLSENYKTKSSQMIYRHLTAMSEYQAAQTVFCFVSTDREVDTHALLTHALAQGKTLCVPRCLGEGKMALHQITDVAELQEGTYGILEPAETTPLIDIDQVDFAILPCLTCNHQGHRLGQGGGYYDRFLSQYRGGTVLLCREQLIRDEIPLEPHDYPIPWVLSEAGLFEDGIRAPLG
ncbi:5-formyltetrahydrofolate cyclo-ligase [Bengtsoniella intestinalis]|uniref:5-formyltetrahydrofolate cyclo-ligase n=1 Tax=Bengtsoniella intestinalis TaxID=3073143 RepID=UPI00391F7357